MLTKMAWRNIWRSRRRSLITMSSIMFAVFFAVAMRSLQFGTYDRLIENIVNSFSGYIQLHQAGYWDDQVVDNAMPLDGIPQLISAEIESVIGVYPRIESFALAASDEKTRGVFVVGLNADLEESMLGLSAKIASGKLFSATDPGLLIGERLAKNLGVSVGDTLILLGQGYHGLSAAGKYPVSGLIAYPSPQMGLSLVLLSFHESEELFSTFGLATSLVIQIEHRKDVFDIRDKILALVDTTKVEALTWEEMMPELVQTIQADSSGGMIMIMILYLVISFGIFGTLLMMLNERQFEFGVLLAIGMSRLRLIGVLIVEMIFLAIGGIIAGVFLALPLQYYFNANPIQLLGRQAEVMESYGWEAIMSSSTDLSISITHAGLVLMVTLLISLYAVVVLIRIRPAEAMRP